MYAVNTANGIVTVGYLDMVKKNENKQLKADAYAHGMNVSEYIRWLVEKERAEANENR